MFYYLQPFPLSGFNIFHLYISFFCREQYLWNIDIFIIYVIRFLLHLSQNNKQY